MFVHLRFIFFPSLKQSPQFCFIEQYREVVAHFGSFVQLGPNQSISSRDANRTANSTIGGVGRNLTTSRGVNSPISLVAAQYLVRRAQPTPSTSGVTWVQMCACVNPEFSHVCSVVHESHVGELELLAFQYVKHPVARRATCRRTPWEENDEKKSYLPQAKILLRVVQLHYLKVVQFMYMHWILHNYQYKKNMRFTFITLVLTINAYGRLGSS